MTNQSIKISEILDHQTDALYDIECQILHLRQTSFGIELIVVDESRFKVQLFCSMQNAVKLEQVTVGNWFKITRLKYFSITRELRIYNDFCLFLTNCSESTAIQFKDIYREKNYKSLEFFQFHNDERFNLQLVILKIMSKTPFLTCTGKIVWRRQLLVTDNVQCWSVFLWKQQCNSTDLQCNKAFQFIACKKSKLLRRTIESVGYFKKLTKKIKIYKNFDERFNMAWLKQALTVKQLNDAVICLKKQTKQAVTSFQFQLFCGECEEVLQCKILQQRLHQKANKAFLVRMKLKDLNKNSVIVHAQDDLARLIFRLPRKKLIEWQNQDALTLSSDLQKLMCTDKLCLFELQIRTFVNNETQVYISSVFFIPHEIRLRLKQQHKFFK